MFRHRPVSACWRILPVCALLLGLARPGLCADVPPLPSYFLRVWQTQDGLPDNAVSAVLQTRDGYLWLGTYGGLARFDGVRFTVFNSANEPELQSDRITGLFEDADGTLWIGHERGDLTCYRNGKFESQQVRETGVRRKISAIGADTGGDIWMLSEEGTLVRVRDAATCALPNQDAVVLTAQNPSGRFWVASGGRLASLEHGQLVSLMDSGGSNSVGGYIQGICASRDGGLWIISDNHVRKWNGGGWTEDRGDNPCNSAVTTMLEIKSGCLALGTLADGLYLLFPNRMTLHFNHANGFPQDWIRCLCEDREGTLWVGAGSGGIVALRPGKVETVNPPDRFQGCVALSTTTSHDGAVWVGSEGAGLYRLLDNEWRHFDQSAGLSNLFVWSVSEDAQRRMWAGTWGGGIFRQQGDHFVVPPGLENVNVPMPAILHTAGGVTWIGTASGLIRYENGAVKWFGEKEGLTAPDVRAVAEAPDGTVWFGMLGDGLGCLRNGVLKQFRKHDGLSSDYVQCLHLDADGVLWIGTYGSGLNRLKDGRFAKITTMEGLPNNFICGIEEDNRGNFWISSHGGIFRVSPKALDDCADGKAATVVCLAYGKGEGMPSLECSGGLQPAACRTADGRIWFPTSKGMAVVNPDNTKVNLQEPPVVIEEVSANGRALAVNPGAKPAVRIVPGSQRLEFQYTGLSFVAPEKMRFQYRLEGWENDWVDADNKRRVAEYSYVPPGDYTFRVRACNSDGVWNETGASLTLTVLPHFWQTWWFRAAGGLGTAVLLAGSVFWAVRRRMRRKLEHLERLRAIERERARIAQDIHDNLGANLTRISLLSESAHGELENPAQTAAQLERIYSTARELRRAMDEIVWAVNPQHDTLDSLASYLGNFAQEYLGSLDIRCRLDVPLQLPAWSITAEVRHNLFLAFKEALHNVVKHAAATEVCISLTTGANAFILVIRDDGKGFVPDVLPPPGRGEPNRIARGHGLMNMHQRLEKIGGSCGIQSVPGSGTEVKFVVAVVAEAA
jgi:ligand-binding sensor domain-containing protein/signal transduction histidine kinase